MLYNSLCCWKSSEGWRFCLLLSHPDKDYNLNSLLPLVDCGPTNGRQLGLAWDLELVHRTILKVFATLFCIQAEFGVCLENAYCSSFEVFFFFLTLHFLAPLPTPQYIRPKTTSSLWCCGGELRKEDRKQKWGFLLQFQHSGHVLFFRSTHCTSGLEELTTLLLPPLHNQQTRKPNILGFPIHPHFPAYRGSSSPLIGEQILLKVGVLSVRIDHSSGSGHF